MAYWWVSQNQSHRQERGGFLWAPDRTEAGLTPSRIERLGVTPTARIIGLREQHLEYLDHHRRTVFVG